MPRTPGPNEPAQRLAWTPADVRGGAQIQVRVRRRQMPQWISKGLVAVSVVLLAGLPHFVAGLGWYPSETDDSLWYLFLTSREVAGDSIVKTAVTSKHSGRGSAYYLCSAAISKWTGMHPMRLFRIASYAGVFMLPACAGAFAYLVTRRWRLSLIAVLIAGLWGGVAGYHWLVRDALPAILDGRPPPLMLTDYYTARHFGEYCSVNSPLTSYLTAFPFHPREIGMCLAWVALGLVYSSVIRRAHRWLLPGALLAAAAVYVYPYYLLAVAIVCVSGAILLIGRARRHSGKLRAWVAPLLPIGIVLLLLLLADQQHRAHFGGTSLWMRLAVALESGAERPPEQFRFRWNSFLSAHIFLFLAGSLSFFFGRRQDPPPADRDVRALTLLIVTGTILTCLLAWISPAYIYATGMYGWLAPWRALLTPLIILAAASGMEALVSRSRYYIAVALMLIPTLSVLHWTANGAIFLKIAKTRPDLAFRARGHEMYDEFAEYGSRLLGRVQFREPLILHGVPLNISEYTQAALGMLCRPNLRSGATEANPYDELLTTGNLAKFDGRIAAGKAGDVLTLRNGDLDRQTATTNAFYRVGELGPYVVLRRVRPVPAR